MSRRRREAPAEVNPIFLRKDWAGNTMEEYKTDGMWGWRTMVAHAALAGKSAPPARKGAQVRVMSFNVLAQSLTSSTRFPYCDRQSLKWRYRRVSLLKEMLSLNADVLCLQELDNYDEWWRGKMGLAGYDGVYLAHQGENRRDGLAVFYKRDLFQLFRTEEVYFNDLASDFANPARAMTGNVALMVGLQPWEESVHASAMCITSTQLVSSPSLSDVHWAQARMLLRRIERFNADFQLPVVICGSFNCRPEHAVYEMMESGVLRELPKAPFKMEDPPTTGDRSRSTIRLHWEVPHEGDAPITGYRIRRRAGGNTAVGFNKELEVHDPHARAFTVCQLSSGTMYEFIVAAVNAVGVGKWSEPSYPVATLTNFKNPPVNRSLQVAPPPRTELQILLQKQAKEAAIMAERKARGLAAVAEIVHADEADAYDSSDEEDYGAGYGYSDGAAGVGTYTGHGQKGMEVTSSGSEESDSSGGDYDSDERSEREQRRRAKRKARANRVRKLYVSRHGMLGMTETNATPRFEDGRACLRQSPVRLPYASGSGRRESLRVHCMCLKSAYAEYNAGAEPRCTQVHETHNATLDYIFYNDETLTVRRLLSVPKVDELRDLDPRAPDQVPDPYDKKPEGWDDRPKIMSANFDTGEMEEIDNPDYQGTWAPRMVANMDKYHSYLPNSQFSSDHFALMAEFTFRDGLLTATAWNSDTTVSGRAAPKTVGKK